MKRIPQLDFFRGVFLLVMTADHFMSRNNIIGKFSNEFIGWMSAASGFVLLSGFTAGMVYSNAYKSKGKDYAYRMGWKRFKTLYTYNIVIVVFVLLAVFTIPFLRHYWQAEIPLFNTQNRLAFLLTPLFIFLPPLFDILPMYILFFLLVPFAIKAFFSGSSRSILGASGLVYLFGFFIFAPVVYKGPWVTTYMPYMFNLFCWQLLFFVALYLGFLFQQGRLQRYTKNKTLFYTALFTALCLFGLKNIKPGIGIDTAYWADKDSLGPLRLLNIACLTYTMAYLAATHKNWFAFKPLCYLGRFSLEVFSFHILVFYLLRPFVTPLNNLWTIKIHETYRLYPWETLLLALVLLSLFSAPFFFLKQKWSALELRLLRKPTKAG